MSNVLADAMQTSVTTPTEARPIEIITAEIQVLKAQVGGGLIEIGNRLLEAKAQLSHGEWLPWLEEKVEFSVSQAQRFMRLAKEYSNTSALTYLGTSKALALLAFEPEEREAFAAESHVVNGEEKTVEDMTSRELEQAIRERKEALEAKEAAEAEKRLAEQSRDKLSQEMTIANATMDSLRETETHLDGVIADLRKEREDLRKELEDLRKQPIDSVYSDAPSAEALDAARQEGAAETAKTAKKEAEERLKAKIEKAEKAKADAEAQVLTIRAEQEATKAKAEALEKQLKLVSNPAATEYKVYFAAVQKDLAGLEDCLDRLATSDPELCAKMTAALAALGLQICDNAAARLEGGAQA